MDDRHHYFPTEISGSTPSPPLSPKAAKPLLLMLQRLEDAGLEIRFRSADGSLLEGDTSERVSLAESVEVPLETSNVRLRALQTALNGLSPDGEGPQLIFITDGALDHKPKLTDIADKAGVQIIAVGVGSHDDLSH